MQRQMTITVDETVYSALQAAAKQRSIGDFLTEVIRNQEFPPPSQRTEAELEAGYRAMAADGEYERDAHEWISGLYGGSVQ